MIILLIYSSFVTRKCVCVGTESAFAYICKHLR